MHLPFNMFEMIKINDYSRFSFGSHILYQMMLMKGCGGGGEALVAVSAWNTSEKHLDSSSFLHLFLTSIIR